MARTQKILSSKDIRKVLKTYEGWEVNARETQLSKTFATNNFVDGLVALARITVHAEILNHHPNVEISYNKVKVKTTTHEAKGLTKEDVALIKRIEKALQPN